MFITGYSPRCPQVFGAAYFNNFTRNLPHSAHCFAKYFSKLFVALGYHPIFMRSWCKETISTYFIILGSRRNGNFEQNLSASSLELFICRLFHGKQWDDYSNLHDSRCPKNRDAGRALYSLSIDNALLLNWKHKKNESETKMNSSLFLLGQLFYALTECHKNAMKNAQHHEMLHSEQWPMQ